MNVEVIELRFESVWISEWLCTQLRKGAGSQGKDLNPDPEILYDTQEDLTGKFLTVFPCLLIVFGFPAEIQLLAVAVPRCSCVDTNCCSLSRQTQMQQLGWLASCCKQYVRSSAHKGIV